MEGHLNLIVDLLQSIVVDLLIQTIYAEEADWFQFAADRNNPIWTKNPLMIYFVPNASKKRLKQLHLNSVKVFISDNMSDLALALAQELISSAPVVTEEGKQVEKSSHLIYWHRPKSSYPH